MELIDWIPSVVMALATTVLAGATIYYAITNRRLWLNMEKQVQRPRREEEIKFIIKPLIKQSEVELNHLNIKRYRYFSKGITLFDKYQSDSSLKVVFNEFIREKHNLKDKIHKHDKLVQNLNEKLKETYDFINTASFQLKVKNLIVEFNKNAKKRISDSPDHLAKDIIEWVICNLDENEIGDTGAYFSFWKSTRKEFNYIKNKKEFQKYLEEIKLLSDSLIQNNKSIITILEDVSSKYLKYGLSLGINR